MVLFRSLLFSSSFSALIPSFFFFNDTATTEIYTLSLHDALPISSPAQNRGDLRRRARQRGRRSSRDAPGHGHEHPRRDRKSTRLNSSHGYISYAVFCLKKKKKKDQLPCCRAQQRTGRQLVNSTTN